MLVYFAHVLGLKLRVHNDKYLREIEPEKWNGSDLPLPGSGVVGGSGVVRSLRAALTGVAEVVLVERWLLGFTGLAGLLLESKLVVFSRLLELDTRLFTLLLSVEKYMNWTEFFQNFQLFLQFSINSKVH